MLLLQEAGPHCARVPARPQLQDETLVERRERALGAVVGAAGVREVGLRRDLQEDVREQLNVLENNVEHLTRMQEQTLLSLAMLTRQIQMHRKARLVGQEGEEETVGDGVNNQTAEIPPVLAN